MSWLPNNILHKETQIVREIAAPWIDNFKFQGPAPTIFCVDQRRGRSYGYQRVVTIPKWVLRDAEYLQEYIIHELSHQEDYDNRKMTDHKKPFWDIFKRVCPQRWWHYEWNYKPGQTKSNDMMLLDLFDTEDGQKKHADELGEDDV
jgi:hypothetical protein